MQLSLVQFVACCMQLYSQVQPVYGEVKAKTELKFFGESEQKTAQTETKISQTIGV